MMAKVNDNNVNEKQTIQNRFSNAFFCGATSGIVAAALTLPFDVTKTYQQIDWAKNSRTQPMKQVCIIT
eukprot:Pgem_evm1s4240